MTAPDGTPIVALEASIASHTPPIVPPKRLSILDDHDLLLDSMSTWIELNARDFELVLTGDHWGDFVRSPNFPGDLVLVDYQLKEDVSIESRVRTCRAAGAKVIVISSLDSRETRERSLNAGAAAFLSKDLPIAEVMDVARSVLGLTVSDQVPTSRPASPAPAPPLVIPKLSAGELDALRLYTSGLSLAEVAESMDVHFETAKTYIRRVREKYVKVGRKAGKRMDLVRRAAEDGHLR